MPKIDIIDFNEDQAQVIIEIEGFGVQAVDLPIDDQGRVPEGEELDKILQQFVPIWEIDRRNKAERGIKNAAAIRARVKPKGPPTPPPIEELRQRMGLPLDQFYVGMVRKKAITDTEALYALKTGTVPAVMQRVIDKQRTRNERFAAEVLFVAGQSVRRTDPLFEALRTELGWDEATADDLFVGRAPNV